MSNWTRAKDAWIARECDGLDVWVNASDGAVCDFQDDSIPHYLTDPAASIRAAEAWVAQKPKQRKWWLRRDEVISATVGDDAVSDTVVGGDPAAALAQALYRAAGGPA